MRTLEVYERTDALARLLFRDIMSDNMIRPKEGDDQKFDYSPDYYITIAQADDFLLNRAALDSDPDFDEIRSRLFQLIATSGIINLAYDEYHTPPLAELGLEDEVVDMIRYTMAVFTYLNYGSITKEDITSLLNGNLNEFCYYNHNVFEGLKIRSESIDKIFDYLSYYFITDEDNL